MVTPVDFPWTAGATFAGRFELVEPLGRGRHHVWRARGSDGPCVVKAAKAPSRLLAEGELLGTLPPPFPRVLSSGTDDAYDWLCLEDCGGANLWDVVQSGRPPWTFGELLDLAEALAGTIVRLRTQGVVHRDLTLGNVLMAGGAGPDRFRVIDLDAAVDGLFEPRTVQEVVGTDWFTAPEILANRRVHPTTDVWSAARVVASVAAGQVVVSWPRDVVAQAALCRLDPHDVRHRALLALLHACNDLDPERRPGAVDLARRLRRLRRPRGAAPVVLGVAGLAAGVLVLLARRPGSAPEERVEPPSPAPPVALAPPPEPVPSAPVGFVEPRPRPRVVVTSEPVAPAPAVAPPGSGRVVVRGEGRARLRGPDGRWLPPGDLALGEYQLEYEGVVHPPFTVVAGGTVTWVCDPAFRRCNEVDGGRD